MQLELFERPTEVTDENLSAWISEIGEKTPLGQFLTLIETQAPRGFIALLNYRAGDDNAENASDLINTFYAWLSAEAWSKELAAYNMADLEENNA